MMELLKHFKELSLHPANAKELKGLILQLAVQGKLTAQWRNAHPELVEGPHSAKSLLEKIKVEKTQLIKDKKIKQEEPLPPISKDEIPFELPENWAWCRLFDLSFQITDGEHQTPPRITEGYRLLSAKNVRDGYIDYENCDYISEENYQKSIKRCNPEIGDLLIVSVGGTIGRVSMVYENIPFALVRSVALIKPLFIISEYLRWAMNSPTLQEIINRKKRGGAQPCLYLGEIKNFIFPVPSIIEQKAIVSNIEQLFAEVDQLEQLTVQRFKLKEQFATSALQRLANGNTQNEWEFLQQHFHDFFNETPNIKKLRETILQLAVQGKLTTHWRVLNPNTESRNEDIIQVFKNFDKIKTGRKKFLKEVKSVIFVDEYLPKNWVKSQLFNLCVLKRGYDLPSDNRIKGKFVVASSGGISGNHNEYKVDEGVVIGRSGSAGSVHYISEKHWPLNTVLYGEDYCGNDKKYVFLFLKSFNFSKYSTSTAVPTLNRNNFLNELISIPPLLEQKAIVQKVNSLMALCDSLEQEVQQSKMGIEKLMKSVLREVFELSNNSL